MEFLWAILLILVAAVQSLGEWLPGLAVPLMPTLILFHILEEQLANPDFRGVVNWIVAGREDRPVRAWEGLWKDGIGLGCGLVGLWALGERDAVIGFILADACQHVLLCKYNGRYVPGLWTAWAYAVLGLGWVLAGSPGRTGVEEPWKAWLGAGFLAANFFGVVIRAWVLRWRVRAGRAERRR